MNLIGDLVFDNICVKLWEIITEDLQLTSEVYGLVFDKTLIKDAGDIQEQMEGRIKDALNTSQVFFRD